VKTGSKYRIAMVGLKGVPAKWGGIEKYVEQVGRRLVERGHKVTVFGSRWYCKDYHRNYYEGIRIIRVPALHLQATDALSNAFFASLRMLVEPFDIVHFHGYASYFFVVPLRALGKITVVTSHGLVDVSWENPKYGGFAHWVIRTSGSIGLRRADCVTTVADHWKRRIKEEFHIEAKVVPAGIDRATYCEPLIIKEKYGLDAEGYILFLGRVDPIKHVDWVSRLRLDRKDMKIVIAGGAQDQRTAKYLADLKDLCVGNSQMTFTGPVVGKEKAELLSNCALFVNPSSSEGLPLTVLEAMSYGRCCLASDIPAHREVIQDGGTGYLFHSGSFEAFNQAVIAVLGQSLLELHDIGSRAKARISAEYDWDRTADLTEEIYRGLIDGK